MTRDQDPPRDEAGPAYDRALAEQLAGGDAALADDLLQRLLAELPAYRERIGQARAHDDWPALWEPVHKLHGGASYCGVPALKSTLADLEQAILDRDIGAIDSGLERLEHELDRLQREVENRKS